VPQKILTVDDAKALRRLVAQTLAPFQCQVFEANNGFNAFFAIQNSRPDLILLDVVMPVMDGVETLRRLKGTPQLVDIPVLMLTSPADRPLIDGLVAMGAAGTLMKPFTPDGLLTAISQILPLKRAQL
jgi:two-component system cell cycle response regulator/two-component system chemotaxis response regulator CheY